ncbi:MAG TPA: molybdopterin-dependent oxidoreductase, partial [Gemmatimonadaceae bacterium]|nr:molybdopterin-dependent oxidoreductase [Gemmatimonadaceae bacterium]
DLCPVGALLSKDSLNKARAWELDRAASVCPGCSQGCNMMVETRDNMVMRLRPRPNDAVNRYFMCDHGRLDYRWMNRQDRVETPLVRQGAALAGSDWERATGAAARLLAGARAYVLASPRLSNEALFVLSQIITHTKGAGAFRVEQGAEAPLAGVDGLALRADRAPNVRGAELLGFTRSPSPLADLEAGDVLVVADEELAGADAVDIARAGAVIVVGTTLPPWARHAASVVLPIANMVEEEGTYTNVAGRVQRFLQARAAPGFARPSWWVLSDLGAELAATARYGVAGDVFAGLAAAHAEFAGMTYDRLGMVGRPIASMASTPAAQGAHA